MDGITCPLTVSALIAANPLQMAWLLLVAVTAQKHAKLAALGRAMNLANREIIMRELLERAARNAGYEIRGSSDDVVIINGKSFFIGGKGERNWSPAESDADAFRLMVDLNMTVSIDTFHDTIIDANITDGKSGARTNAIDHNNDKAAATRMAILRAAAGGNDGI